MLLKPTRHPLQRKLQIGNAWLLVAFLTVLFPDLRVEAGGLPEPWVKKTTVTPHSGTAGASVIDDKIYLIGGMGDGWLDSKANSVFDPVLNKWEGRKDMPEARSFVSTAMVDGILYAIGGATGSLNPTAKSSLYAYDPVADNWTTKKDLPRPTYGCGAGVVDGVIYAFGGAYNKDSMRCETIAYNPASDEWTTLTPRPAWWGGGATVYDGLIYTFGGLNKDQTASAVLYVYDPKSDSWTKKTDMPTARAACRSSLVGGKIYVIGGYQKEGSALASVEVYDPVNDTWTVKPDMPETSTMHAQAAVEGRIYVMGGTSDWVTGGQSNWEYNPSLDPPAPSAWAEKEKLPFGRIGGCTSEVDNKIYMMGGLTSGAPNYYNTFYNQVYNPATNDWGTLKHMPTGRAFLSTAVVNGVIYAIGGGYPTPYLDTVEAYDPRSNTWTTKACLTKPCMGSSTAAVNGTIYLIGGNLSDSLCFAYNPSANSWTSKKPRPQGGPCSAVAYRGLIYTFGGGGYAEPVSRRVFVYDPEADQWTRKHDMPTPKTGMKAYVVFGKIYLIGGFKEQNSSLETVEVYDPYSDEWATKQEMPFSSCFVQGVDVDGKIYVMAGTPDWQTGGEANWEYNPALDTVAELYTGPADVRLLAVPMGFALEQNYPNPFNPTTAISGQWSVASVVRLVVYDLLGREVAVLADGRYPAGIHSFRFDASRLASGVYFYRLTAGKNVATRAMILQK